MSFATSCGSTTSVTVVRKICRVQSKVLDIRYTNLHPLLFVQSHCIPFTPRCAPERERTISVRTLNGLIIDRLVIVNAIDATRYDRKCHTVSRSLCPEYHESCPSGTTNLPLRSARRAKGRNRRRKGGTYSYDEGRAKRSRFQCKDT